MSNAKKKEKKKRTLSPTLVLQMRKLRPKYESDIRKDIEPFSSRASSQTQTSQDSSSSLMQVKKELFQLKILEDIGAQAVHCSDPL